MRFSIIPFLRVVYSHLLLAVFLPVADQALGHAGLLPIGATALCLFSLAPFSIAVLLQPSGSRYIIHLIRSNLSSIFPFFAMAALALLLGAHPNAFWHENGKWIFLLPYGLIVTILACVMGRFWLSKSVLSIGSLISLSALLGSIIVDYFFPGTFAPLDTRAAGFSGNANYSALVAVCICASALSFQSTRVVSRTSKTARPVSLILRQQQSQLLIGDIVINTLLFLLAASCIILTMSRSGAIHLIALYTFFAGYRTHHSRRILLSALTYTVLIPSLIAIVSLCLVKMSDKATLLQENTRLIRFINHQQVDDGSASSRLQALLDSLRLIEQAPLIGHGTGYARTMPELPHNLYLQQWVNNGILGVLFYVGFLVSLFVTFSFRAYPAGQALTIVAITGSIFSHNLLDQRPFLILIGLALGYSLQNSAVIDIRRLRPQRDTELASPENQQCFSPY
jgi:O-antigen ligase